LSGASGLGGTGSLGSADGFGYSCGFRGTGSLAGAKGLGGPLHFCLIGGAAALIFHGLLHA
ncbi:MAG: hypothetical protein WCE75_13485, partial [Terracidiphilus sp.]